MRRGVRIALLAIPVVLVIADLTAWRISTVQLEAGFQTWVDTMRRQGWSVTVGATKVGGWPFEARLSIIDLAVTGGAPVAPGGLFWDAKQVSLRLDLLHPLSLDIVPVGVQRIRFGQGPDLPFVADAFHIYVPLNADIVPDWFDLSLDGLRLEVPTEGEATETLTLRRLGGHVDLEPGAEQGKPAISWALNAEGVHLPPTAKWPLGPTIASIVTEGLVTGPVPQAGTLSAMAGAWRDSGGSLDIQKLNLAWGPLTVTASASVALDDQLQPMGAGTSKMTGYDATLDALASNGVLTRSAAKAAKAVLSLLATAPAQDETATVEVPLTLQFRTLSMRQVPLVRLPELEW